ncbi:MAG: bifunctional nuclease domain-containing protein, partial [Chitinophagales bacterium]
LPMRKIELEIVVLSHNISQSQSYAVVLGEKEGLRRLPIVIGAYEAQAIAVVLNDLMPARPLTHDLMKNLCIEFDIDLREVIISDLKDGIFYATLVCQMGENILEVDSRTSDALALAVRYGCPIYTYEFILEQAGIILEESVKEQKRSGGKEVAGFTDLKRHTIDKLNNMLEDAIAQEDYEKAAKLRDEINKRA